MARGRRAAGGHRLRRGLTGVATVHFRKLPQHERAQWVDGDGEPVDSPPAWEARTDDGRVGYGITRGEAMDNAKEGR